MAQKYSHVNPYAYYGNQVPGYSNQPVYSTPSTPYNPYAQAGGPLVQPGAPNVGAPNPAQFVPGMLPLEESYIENILRLNKGKLARVYMTFEDKVQKKFTGIVEAAGRDHIILSDPQTGMRYLLLMVYLDYVTFDEELEYEYPYSGAGPGASAGPGAPSAPITSYPPR